ncbi:MAG: amino acid adenylation domain-containing protein [Lentisphaerae bacterium]|nr:amino acid adenylation domain-containing protein [Lentisphaerota bacterium]
MSNNETAVPPSVPLSYAQERMWYIDQVMPGTPLYNIPLAWELTGPLNEIALAASINTIIRRHDVMRTTFDLVDGAPIQRVAPFEEMDLPVIDLEPVPAAAREAALAAALSNEANKPFDLAEGPLLRAALIRMETGRHVLSFTPHHVIFDGASRRLFLQELAALYEATGAAAATPLPALPLQYADFAVWQRTTLTKADMARQLTYWKQALVPGSGTLALTPDQPRPNERTHHGAAERLHLAASPQILLELCNREGTTPFMLLLAAYATTLHLLSEQTSIAIACPVSDREHPDVGSVIGFFVNTMILEAHIEPDGSFRDVLQDVRGTCLDGFSHRSVPFQRVVEAIQPVRTATLTPLFETMFTFEDMRDMPQSMGDVGIRLLPVDHDSALTDLLFETELVGDGLDLTLIYSRDLFTSHTAARILRHFQAVLRQITADPEIGIQEISLLDEGDRAQLAQWNQTQVDYGTPTCVHERFERQAAQTPHALALLAPPADAAATASGDQRMDYDELNGRANQLAHHLRARGIGPDTTVGICSGRSFDVMIGVLGILKAGAAYVPLDPEYPQHRLAVMIEDSKVALVLAAGPAASAVEGLHEEIIRLDDAWPIISEQPTTNPGAAVTCNHLAYVLYTSGSTGRPKGVAMPHGPLSNLIEWQVRDSVMGHANRTLHFAPLSFDVSFQELFSTWCSGGTVVLIPDTQRGDGTALLAFMTSHQIERVFLPFVALQLLADAAINRPPPASLREIMTAGEQLQITPAVAALCRSLPDCTLYNQYGPTEAHVVTRLRLDGAPSTWPALPPIGRPIANVRIHILDRHRRELPVGQPGELYIGGAALARGYLNQAELTAAHFVADPFSSDRNDRLYRTGDLARYRSDGHIEFLGRIDNQFKVRGFRVEPGEIEAVLVAHEGVSQSAVALADTQPGDQRLTAYFVPNEGAALTGTVLREHLRSQLPDYMVPQFFVELDQLPMTPSGKIDRRKLPSPTRDTAGIRAESYVAAQSDTEKQIAEIWQELLGVDRVGMHDQFFALGGHSLLAIQAMARIEKATGVRLTPHDLLFNTLEQLAPLCESVADSAPQKKKRRLFFRR